ncbi:uncharacterized protein LOC128987747 [Macrosteles quadrilineatus]|uniref:uncharacterized protein LOC128987747 n=1 Tax=Macrosteles quadrilineatus TaxID=74068 RepID=UPI0023E20C27|nr:uncharacterized protein LOC128987747 [Macrosteles quadrilineatus]
MDLKNSKGHIINGTSICVDYWVSSPEKKFDHFLTHLHTDNTVRLNSNFQGKIYSSPFNCWLLQKWFKIKPEQLEALSVGDTHLVTNRENYSFYSVTLLEANHCPGSVMFLFQGTFGNILYTGHFRYSPTILDHPMLKSLIENEAVDMLYLDNTYAAENCEFPSRQEALKDLIKLIKEHPDHTILLGLRTLGKEEVLRALALEFKEKICVKSDKLTILKHLGYEDCLFTPYLSKARILVAEMDEINERFINKVRASKGPVIAIVLTALYNKRPPHTNTDTDINNGIYKIPYSDHSCHSEIVKFVSEIKPKQIMPVVRISEKSKLYHCNVIPESILKFCRDSETVEEISQTLFKPGTSVGAASSLENNVISYMTKGSVASFKTGGFKTKTAPALKVKECNRQKLNVERKAKGDPELISRRNCSPRVSFKEHNQDVRVSQKVNGSPFRSALSNQFSNQEYLTLSDEELSEKQQDVPNKSSEQATSDVEVNAVQKGSNRKYLESNASCTSADCDDSPNNQTVIPNKNLIVPCIPLLSDTSQFISKHSVKPMSKRNAASVEELSLRMMRKHVLKEKTVHKVTDRRMFQTNDKASKIKEHNQDVRVSQKVNESPFRSALSTQFSSQEYFTLSDEELSEKQQDVPNKSSEQATSDVEVNAVQKGSNRKYLESNASCTSADCDDSPNNQTVIPNKNLIVPCIPLLSDTSQFISKHSVKPMSKRNAASVEEVDQGVRSEPIVLRIMRKDVLKEKTVHKVTDRRMFQTNDKASKESNNSSDDHRNVCGKFFMASRVISPEKYPLVSYPQLQKYLTYARQNSIPVGLERSSVMKQLLNKGRVENGELVPEAENGSNYYEKVRDFVWRSQFHSKIYNELEDLPYQKTHLNHDQEKAKTSILNIIFHSNQTTCTPAQVTEQNVVSVQEEDDSDGSLIEVLDKLHRENNGNTRSKKRKRT